MSHVIAFLDQSTCRAYRTAAEVPEGATIFEKPEDLANALPADSMDRVRSKLLGESCTSSPSREVAAQRLWYVLSLGANTELRMDFKYFAQKDSFGNRKFAENGRLELIHLAWVEGEDAMIDSFRRKLPKQAQQILQMLIDDGRRIWTGDQFMAVLSARKDEVKTRQKFEKIAVFYRIKMMERRILRRVTFAEFAAKPEFANMFIE